MPIVEYEHGHGGTRRVEGRYADTDERGEFVVVLSEDSDGTSRMRIPIQRVVCIRDGVIESE